MGRSKNDANKRKHGISFEEAQEIFQSYVFTATDDRVDYGKERLVGIGLIQDVFVIVVVYTDRNEVTRIISARKASRKEREVYYAHFQGADRET